MLAESETSTSPAERDELEWLLHSRGLGRSTNLARALRYICEEYFAGRSTDIREYTIAVQALGRRHDFDPQTDTIVRVTVHSLRKRLEDIYEAEGADRPLRLLIPLGGYTPHFVLNSASTPTQAAEATVLEVEDAAPPPIALPPPEAPPTPEVPQQFHTADEEPQSVAENRPAQSANRRPWIAASILLFLATAISLVIVYRHRPASALDDTLKSPATSPKVGPVSEIHALLGVSRASYTDHTGQHWSATTLCAGGSAVPSPETEIEGTEDPALYAGGVRGIVRCEFPVKPGLYEMHFLFSEPSRLSIATRVAQVSINAGPYSSFDVVDEAGGIGRATSMVIGKIAPENDGSLHVDYISEVSPLNAIEILPITSGSLLPIRIVAGPTPVTDAEGNRWMSDRYFVGGRLGQPPAHTSGKTTIYDSDRVGRFSYRIPVAPQGHYRVRLFFKDPWFGPGNGGNGGPGSRIFDVSCNGLPLLRDFDILAAGNGQPVIKTFDDVQASRTGRLELAFLPEVNYPIVNAIEITPLD
jgi:hypothetical protein